MNPVFPIFTPVSGTVRQQKFSRLIQKELSDIFQRDQRGVLGNAFITIVDVRMSPDLSLARVYISMMLAPDKKAVLEKLDTHKKEIRKALGDRIRNQARIIPELAFFIDEVEENAQRMNDLLKGLHIPPADPAVEYAASTMNLSFFIARRYFLSRRKKNFINVISVLSMLGVAFATAALIIVLSVFNGLEVLLRSLYTSFDPELKIEALHGKSFPVSNAWLDSIRTIPGVKTVTEVIEDYAYVRYRDAAMVVTIKGVSENFLDQHRLDDHIVEGELKLTRDSIPFAILGRGVRYTLSAEVDDDMRALRMYYIKNVKSGVLNPSSMYSQKSIRPGSVFSIEKNYDENYIFVPLAFARDLLDYDNRRTAVEVQTEGKTQEVQQTLRERLGERFSILTNEEQHKDLYRLLNMERLFTFLALSLLLLVASINIFFSLMMLAIDKKKDISILMSMGATGRVIRNIFLAEGAVISFVGAMAGLLIGGLLCFLQDRVGLVGMGMENAIIANYPVQVRAMDFFWTSLTILLISVSVSIRPAVLASRSYSISNL